MRQNTLLLITAAVALLAGYFVGRTGTQHFQLAIAKDTGLYRMDTSNGRVWIWTRTGAGEKWIELTGRD